MFVWCTQFSITLLPDVASMRHRQETNMSIMQVQILLQFVILDY